MLQYCTQQSNTTRGILTAFICPTDFTDKNSRQLDIILLLALPPELIYENKESTTRLLRFTSPSDRLLNGTTFTKYTSPLASEGVPSVLLVAKLKA